MSKEYSIFDAAHKGDFEFISAKLEEDPNLLHQTDSVSKLDVFNLILLVMILFRIREC